MVVSPLYIPSIWRYLCKCIDGIDGKSVLLPKNMSNITGTHMVESEYNWTPLRDYFKDVSHPCRLPFDSTWNFDRGVHGAILDEKVQRHFRDLQIAT